MTHCLDRYITELREDVKKDMIHAVTVVQISQFFGFLIKFGAYFKLFVEIVAQHLLVRRFGVGRRQQNLFKLPGGGHIDRFTERMTAAVAAGLIGVSQLNEMIFSLAGAHLIGRIVTVR